ncbi:putative small multi-drug export [Macleaya cordata]|uniref:Putative small multi-drug export n=1 Tax=Macleaya cordata TaxID=56857 RepID=A0A200QF61_MACCD|nr:putative small multi-drug export [Macleaya cordata]
MAAITASVTFSPLRTHQRISPLLSRSIISPQLSLSKPKLSSVTRSFSSLFDFSPIKTTTTSATKLNDVLLEFDNRGVLLYVDEEPRKTIKFIFWVLVWTSVSVALSAAFGDTARASTAADSIRSSSFGVKVANALRGSGWPDEAVVFALATLPVVELRGAIPVGYWLQLKPVLLTVLSVLGNMVPVPFIVLYLKPFATFLAQKSPSASRFLDLLFTKAREKAGPIEEFQWLGLMLFVAVPFPGTGAWTGAIIASLINMPFWSAVSANFCGVVFAGLLYYGEPVVGMADLERDLLGRKRYHYGRKIKKNTDQTTEELALTTLLAKPVNFASALLMIDTIMLFNRNTCNTRSEDNTKGRTDLP